MNDRGRKWKRFKAAAAVLGVVLLAGAAGVTVHPVSYTHLDVDKRQENSYLAEAQK